jgi:phosphohistidine phosphatase
VKALPERERPDSLKTLLLLRHAKSSWDDPSLPDFQRPLAPRGMKAAPRMGRYMRENDLIPDVVLCSAAVRTRQTWALVSAELRCEPEVRFQRGLYLSDPAHLLMEIHVQPDAAGTVLLIGHNPGIETLARRLAGFGPDGELERLSTKYPTGALAVLRYAGERWSGVIRGSCELESFVRPKDLD